MKRRNLYFLIPNAIYTFSLLFLSASCERPIDDDDPVPVPHAAAQGVYLLNEGVFDMNNSTITYYDFKSGTHTADIFSTVNGRGLGDTGNDLQSYGSKMYAVVNVSEQIEVMSLKDCRSIQRIPLPGKQPRKIAFAAGKGYVSCFDGTVVRIDTATLQVDGTALSGANPDGIAVVGNKLYVANSGGLNYPNYGNTLSVFDLSDFTLLKTIEVALNPVILKADSEGDLYLVSQGDYASVPYQFQRIDTHLDEVVQNHQLPVLNFDIHGRYAYLYSYDYFSGESWIKVMDVFSEEIAREHFITDQTRIQVPYGIRVNPSNGDVYIADAPQFTVAGDIYCFDKEGKLKFTFEAGLNPKAFVFKY